MVGSFFWISSSPIFGPNLEYLPVWNSKRLVTNQPNFTKASLQSDILTSFTSSLQQDVQLFNFTSFSTPGRLLSLPLDHLLSSLSFSPAWYPHFLHWQPAAGRPTLQLHQLFHTSKATSSAAGPASLQSDFLTFYTGGLQQELQLFNLTSISRYTSLQPLPSAYRRTSNSSTLPASPVPAQQDASRTSSFCLGQVQGGVGSLPLSTFHTHPS